MPPEAATRLRRTDLKGDGLELQLDSADGLNRLSLPLLGELAAIAAGATAGTAVILCGNARNFSAGADLAAIAGLDAVTARRLGRQGQRHLQAIADSPACWVAAVEGNCLGGGLDLALACQYRICTETAYFGHHGARLGLVTGWGGTQRLPRLIGAGATLRHLLAARGWTAVEARDEGLVTAVCAAENLRPTALARLGRPA